MAMDTAKRARLEAAGFKVGTVGEFLGLTPEENVLVGDKVELSLHFEDNGTEHHDLVLRFAGERWDCDSYYLALAGASLPGQKDADKIRVILRMLLEQWLSAVENFSDGSTVYLPYDFSDQYTGWLRCFRSGSTVEMCRGWARVEGWAISPSTIGQHLTQVPGFQPDSPFVRIPLEELVEAVRNTRDQT